MFKLPKIPMKENVRFDSQADGLKQFDYSELTEKDQLGQGAFGMVFTASYQGRKVVVKKMLASNREESGKFFKEARLLNSFNDYNIVKFQGICSDPVAILLEYLFFDFTPFVDKELRVSCLEDFLSSLDEMDAVNLFPVQNKILNDVASGLRYLHQADCHHRDLKTANVLVSNQHYCHLKDNKEVLEAFNNEPIVCKLTDFGESRSKEIQTAEVIHTCTNNVARGTPAYMAPEILCDSTMSSVTSTDLKRIDIWAFGMIVYSVLNPDTSFPYKHDIERARALSKGSFDARNYIKTLMVKQQRPTASEKYKERQKTTWSHLVEAFERSTGFEPSLRPTISELFEILDSDVKHYKFIALKVNQGSAVENVDKQIALGNSDVSTSLTNDGTNSCAFLCVMMAEQLLKGDGDQLTMQEIADIAEEVITETPSQINNVRNKEILYDSQEAYTLMRNEGILHYEYEISEEIISSACVFSEEGKVQLARAIQNLKSMPERVAVALYTCFKTVVLLGSLRGQLFLIDTHYRVEDMNGGKTACVTFFNTHPNEVQHLCSWLVRGLRKNGVSNREYGEQSFSIMTRNSYTLSCGSNSFDLSGNQSEQCGEEVEFLEEVNCNQKESKVIIKDDGDSGRNDAYSFDSVPIEIDSSSNEDILRTTIFDVSHTIHTNKNIDSSNTVGNNSYMVSCSSTANSDVLPSYGDQPVLKSSSCGLKLYELVRICVNEDVPKEKICSKVPMMVDKSAIFVIDLSVVNHLDLTADDSGAYRGHSSPSVAIEIPIDEEGNLGQLIRTLNKEDRLSSSKSTRRFLVRRQYSWHSLSKEYRRIVTKVEENNKLLRFAVVQYIINTQDTSILFQKPYGNSKKNKEPYIRTKPSVLENIRKIGQKGTAKEIITEIEDKCGSVKTVPSSSYIPRDRNQVYKQVKKVDGRIKSRSTGPAATPDFPKLMSLQYSGNFVKNVNFSVKTDKKKMKRAAPNTFAASDTCLRWAKRFCTGTNPAAVAGVDMTYKLGPFYLTTMTFPNPMFVQKANDQKHPTTLAAIMTSVTKDKTDYEYFARSLKAQGIKTLAYGMDGECAMEGGFEEVFPILNGCSGANIHLRCFDHVRDDINQKLVLIQLSENERKEIIFDILGKEYGGTREMGLVDCKSPEEFEQKYIDIESKWPSDFQKWMTTNCGRVRCLKETLKQCMLRNVRTAAGLGDPPSKWSNQRTESLNNVIKEANKCQTTDQVSIHEIIEKKVIHQQESEYIKAIYNTGEYRLAERYKKYSIGALEWSRKTEEQRKEYVKKVLNSDIDTGGQSNQEQVITRKLSIDILDCGIQTVATGLLNNIWHQANVILSAHQILNLSNDVYCVTEFGTSTNVLVKEGNISCNCRHSKSTAGLCPHTLVVAETMGNLSNYLSKFNKRNQKSGRIVFGQIPKRSGEKPKEKKKRKGQNNVQSIPVSSEKQQADDDVDFAKPMIFKAIWHNSNPFNVVFTRDVKRVIKCESCKIEFPKGEVTCIPHDITIQHFERYYYPKKNDKGKLVGMEPTLQKEVAKFYCPRKECILKRHPYFWKGMVQADHSVIAKLRDGHRKFLENQLHFIF